MDYKELKELYKRAKRIIASDLDWETKYNLIFSDDMSMKVKFDWFDPDMDYQDDVMAWIDGFDRHMRVEKIIAQQID
jgi:ATP:corrinoid adenosyltransferase